MFFFVRIWTVYVTETVAVTHVSLLYRSASFVLIATIAGVAIDIENRTGCANKRPNHSLGTFRPLIRVIPMWSLYTGLYPHCIVIRHSCSYQLPSTNQPVTPHSCKCNLHTARKRNRQRPTFDRFTFVPPPHPGPESRVESAVCR